MRKISKIARTHRIDGPIGPTEQTPHSIHGCSTLACEEASRTGASRRDFPRLA